MSELDQYRTTILDLLSTGHTTEQVLQVVLRPNGDPYSAGYLHVYLGMLAASANLTTGRGIDTRNLLTGWYGRSNPDGPEVDVSKLSELDLEELSILAYYAYGYTGAALAQAQITYETRLVEIRASIVHKLGVPNLPAACYLYGRSEGHWRNPVIPARRDHLFRALGPRLKAAGTLPDGWQRADWMEQEFSNLGPFYRRIARLAACGMSNAQMRHHLYVNDTVVRQAIAATANKLGVHAEAIGFVSLIRDPAWRA